MKTRTPLWHKHILVLAATSMLASPVLAQYQFRVPLNARDGASAPAPGLPLLQFNPGTSLDFNDVDVGNNSTLGPLSLLNAGTGAASGVVLEAPAGFTLVDNTCSGALAASGSCSFYLRFSPTATTTYSGAVSGTATPTTTASLSVAGRGTGAVAGLQSGSLNVNFGTASWNAPAPTQAVTYRNDGNAALTLNVTGVDTSQFSVNNGCVGVAPGALCTVTFSMPTSNPGTKSDPAFNVSDGTTGAQAGTLLGLVGAPVAQYAATTVAFSTPVVTGTSATRTVDITNTGSVGGNFRDQANLPAGFSSSGCDWVAVGATCTLTLTFAPTAVGGVSSSTVHPTNAYSTATPLTVSGTGEAPYAGPPIQDVVINSNTVNYVLSNVVGSSNVRTFRVTISPGVTVSSSSYATPAFRTGTLASGSVMILVNNGNIRGAGGRGGKPDAITLAERGQAGGTALDVTVSTTITNNGTIWGGGGGGAGVWCSGASQWGGHGGAGTVAGAGYSQAGVTTGNAGNATTGGAQTSSPCRVVPAGGLPGGYGGSYRAGDELHLGGAGGTSVMSNGNTVTFTAGDNDPALKGPRY